MGERIIAPDKPFYAGGTVPRFAGSDGLKEPEPMSAAVYVSKITRVVKPVYKGGTVSSIAPVEDNSDDMGRQLFS